MRKALNGLSWHVFNPEGELSAAVRHAEDAGALVAVLGDGSEIRFDNSVVWSEGKEAQPASESYDFVASTVHERIA